MIDPPPLFGHLAGRVAGARHHAQDVDRHDALEIGEVVVEKAAVHPAGDSGVVHHHVEAAEVLDGPRLPERRPVRGRRRPADRKTALATQLGGKLFTPVSHSTSAITTRAPSAKNFSTIPAPMPEAPPVTIATLPSSSLTMPKS